MKKVPDYARVTKPEYKEFRKRVETVAWIYNFHFIDLWNLMIDTMNERHAKVLAGKAKSDMTLAQAVDNISEQMAKERGRRDALAIKEAKKNG